MRQHSSWRWYLSLAFLLLFYRPSFSQTNFVCAESDSAVADTVAAHLVTISSAFHRFGENTSTWPHEFDLYANDEFKAFRQVFGLYLTDHVSGRFSTPEWEDILNAIMNNDTTVAPDDVFGNVWDYFAREEYDSNDAYAAVRFTANGAEFDSVAILLYDTADGVGIAYSTYFGNTLLINASSGNGGVEYILGQGIAHEFQHLCFSVNKDPVAYAGLEESLSTVAEYFLDSWRPVTANLPYDASFMDYEPCDLGAADKPKYQVYKAWMLYLYEVFKGNEADPTDDLLYRWIRNDANLSHRLMLDTLADLLWAEDDYDWVGGVDAKDRLTRMYANFVAAKFCNAPEFSANSQFGSGSVNTVTDLGFFTDNDNCTPPPPPSKVPDSPIDCPPYESFVNNSCWTVRVLLPLHELSEGDENMTTTKEHFHYGSDGSVDSIEVYNYGTDYIVFRADEYFDDGQEHELKVSVRGRPVSSGSSLNAIQPLGWVMGYSTDSDTLQVHPESLVFVEPITFSPATTYGATATSRTITVTDFGRSIKAVVLAIGSVSLRPDFWDFPSNAFTYEYEYGVFTPGASSRTWDGDVYALGDVTVASGGTLEIDPGTRVRVLPNDLSESGSDEDAIEFLVEGELDAGGTDDEPIVFETWIQDPLNVPVTPTWVGIYIDSLSAGAVLDHCRIRDAETAIESWVSLTVRNSEITSCSYSGVLSKNGGGLIDGCILTEPGYIGVSLENGTLTVRNTIVDSAVLYGFAAEASTTLNLRGTIAQLCNTGLYQEGNNSGSTDSLCYFYECDTGIHLYNVGSGPIIRDSVVGGNTSTAILCDQSSHPLIDDNIIGFNGNGIYCSNSSSPVITANSIQSSGNCVSATSSANPDVGHASPTGGQSPGNNNIAHTTGKLVANYNSSGTIYAENNCWNRSTGDYTPNSSLFQGSVDRNPALPCEFERWDDESVIEPEFGEGFVFQMPPTRKAPAKPAVTGLVSVVPNPFNPTTTIHYAVAAPGKVDIKIFDVAGRLVQELASGAKTTGSHSAVWNGIDRSGSQVASGVYFVRMVAAGQVFTKKMVMLK